MITGEAVKAPKSFASKGMTISAAGLGLTYSHHKIVSIIIVDPATKSSICQGKKENKTKKTTLWNLSLRIMIILLKMVWQKIYLL